MGQSQIQSKMGSILLKKTTFLIFIVSFVLCDEVIEKMERRINELETLNKELKDFINNLNDTVTMNSDSIHTLNANVSMNDQFIKSNIASLYELQYQVENNSMVIK